MKLTLERVAVGSDSPFALFIDGVMLPDQAKTEVVSEPGKITKVIVTFNSDPMLSDSVQIVGDPK